MSDYITKEDSGLNKKIIQLTQDYENYKTQLDEYEQDVVETMAQSDDENGDGIDMR